VRSNFCWDLKNSRWGFKS